MDLAQFDSIKACEEGAVMEIMHPTSGEILRDEETGEPWTITFIGIDSKELKAIQHTLQNKRLKALSRRGQVEVTAEQIDSDELEMVIKATRSWNHLQLDGNKIDCNDLTKRNIYSRFPWLLEQASFFINGRKNFLGNSRKP